MASATIPAGAEVTDIYSSTFYDMEQSERARKCAEYEFVSRKMCQGQVKMSQS